MFSSMYFILKFLFVVVCFYAVNALYEDQIGKFDWRQQYIGKIAFTYVDPLISGTHRFYVVTEKNVLACLSTRTGSILWREVLEKDSLGAINALSESKELITVSGNGQFIRSWDTNTGILQWETAFPNLPSDKDLTFQFSINTQNKEIIMVAMHKNSHVKVSIYNYAKASVKTSATIETTWINEHFDCKFISSNYFLCINKNLQLMYLLSVRDGGLFMSIPLKNFGVEASSNLNVMKVITLPYQSDSDKPYFALQLDSDFILFQIQPPGVKLQRIFPKLLTLTSTVVDSKFVLFTISHSDNNYKVIGIDPESSQSISNLEGNFKLSNYVKPEIAFILPYMKKDQGSSYKLLLSTEDHSVLLIHQQGRMIWTREEALADIISVEILDLPLSETDASIEQEFGDADASILNMFLTRLKSQMHMFQMILQQSLAELKPSDEDSTSEREIVLSRDTFGLHKVIIAVTSPGKIFSIDNLSGQIVWSHYERDLLPFVSMEKPYLPIFVQRTTAHFPYPPQCTILGQHKNSEKTHLYSFDPITGKTVDSKVLPYTVLQSSFMGVMDSYHIRGILLLDSELKVHTYPDSVLSILLENKDTHFIFIANTVTGILKGYSLHYYSDQNPYATQVWEVYLPHNILHISLKRPLEHVHSQGRVMGDRSVLYKYLNANLAAVFTEGNDTTQKSFCNIYLIDTITGLIVYSATHKKCKTPIHVVHSENWVIYSYYNDKSRRIEISSIELFEGMFQSNSTAFSSFSPPPLPLVEHQTFIFPSLIGAMTDTVTERGLTNKHLLIALPTGAILELPKTFIDPRRPINPTPEHREEGLIPYIPELPIMSEGIINYNQSVMRISGIQTAPSGLESTCLVFAYGLDLFYTRVTPSKTFDILKDDFDHNLISAVLVGLLLLSYTTKKLAARKSLRASWK